MTGYTYCAALVHLQQHLVSLIYQRTIRKISFDCVETLMRLLAKLFLFQAIGSLYRAAKLRRQLSIGCKVLQIQMNFGDFEQRFRQRFINIDL